MHRKVHLLGQLGDRFGETFNIYASTYQDVLRCIDVNREGFRDYILKCHEDNISFTFETAGESIESEEDFLKPLKPGDITISAVPSGSKSGLQKILAAVVLFYVAPWAAGKIGAATGISSAKVLTTIKTVATNIAIQGVMQIMAPDPKAADTDEPTNYLFNGDTQNVVEGDPIPVLYGELTVPGQPISIHQGTGNYSVANHTTLTNGDIVRKEGSLTSNSFLATITEE